MERQRFSPERLLHIRRLRRARRLYKKQPLFAMQIMQIDYKGYDMETLCDDLRRRSPPKKRRGKSYLTRFGRYNRMQQLLTQYHLTGNIDFAIRAQKLRNLMTKPYRVMLIIGNTVLECTFCPLIAINQMEDLMAQLNTCQTMERAEDIIEKFRKSH